MKEDKIIGILGGMGPMATVILYKHFINSLNVKKDQDHPKLIIYSNPKIPDRTGYTLGNGEDPYPLLQKTAADLENFGADVITIPCNTAHYFYDRLQSDISIKIINMIEETFHYCSGSFPDKTGGLLSTTGTLKTGIYDKYFGESLVKVECNAQENLVMNGIYGSRGIKSGNYNDSKKLLIKAANILIEKGADYIIAGCTEIPIVLKSEDIIVPLIDPMKILAEKALEYIGYKQR